MMRHAVLVLLCAKVAAADPTPVSPVAMAGPYKSLEQACVKATPCGGTEVAKGTLVDFIKPRKAAVCALATDPNGETLDGKPSRLDHKVGDMTIQIASQSCAVPDELRWEHSVYYVFVKRADGWWRSAPMWQWKYNDKYEAGMMYVKWNDQPGRTFAGIAATHSSLACMKNGNVTETIELMLRVEAGTKSPIVYPPLVVGERWSLEAFNVPSDIDCKPSKKTFELAETWSGADELELAGPATWFGTHSVDGALDILLDNSALTPSAAGHYHFQR